MSTSESIELQASERDMIAPQADQTQARLEAPSIEISGSDCAAHLTADAALIDAETAVKQPAVTAAARRRATRTASAQAALLAASEPGANYVAGGRLAESSDAGTRSEQAAGNVNGTVLRSRRVKNRPEVRKSIMAVSGSLDSRQQALETSDDGQPERQDGAASVSHKSSRSTASRSRRAGRFMKRLYDRASQSRSTAAAAAQQLEQIGAADASVEQTTLSASTASRAIQSKTSATISAHSVSADAANNNMASATVATGVDSLAQSTDHVAMSELQASSTVVPAMPSVPTADPDETVVVEQEMVEIDEASKSEAESLVAGAQDGAVSAGDSPVGRNESMPTEVSGDQSADCGAVEQDTETSIPVVQSQVHERDGHCAQQALAIDAESPTVDPDIVDDTDVPAVDAAGDQSQEVTKETSVVEGSAQSTNALGTSAGSVAADQTSMYETSAKDATDSATGSQDVKVNDKAQTSEQQSADEQAVDEQTNAAQERQQCESEGVVLTEMQKEQKETSSINDSLRSTQSVLVLQQDESDAPVGEHAQNDQDEQDHKSTEANEQQDNPNNAHDQQVAEQDAHISVNDSVDAEQRLEALAVHTESTDASEHSVAPQEKELQEEALQEDAPQEDAPQEDAPQEEQPDVIPSKQLDEEQQQQQQQQDDASMSTSTKSVGNAIEVMANVLDLLRPLAGSSVETSESVGEQRPQPPAAPYFTKPYAFISNIEATRPMIYRVEKVSAREATLYPLTIAGVREETVRYDDNNAKVQRNVRGLKLVEDGQDAAVLHATVDTKDRVTLTEQGTSAPPLPGTLVLASSVKDIADALEFENSSVGAGNANVQWVAKWRK